ncbi:MAG: ABC transporter ATP-binding protein [Tannerellaceae bacterium]|jgi:lipoprotein-releasing system ATP-binding protein|nr:ABC transporter ATP-binding protein [Tannerellaceae bacterium]
MEILRVENLNKHFYTPADFWVLKDLCFSIDKGKLTSITGKSGSGKSTLLYLLSTMDTDFEGSIRINGEEIKGRSNKWLSGFRNTHIGFIFQFHYLLPDFTVLQNVMLPALKQGKYTKEQIEHNAMELLTLLNVKSQSAKRASLLSGGQQQRVAIARALINEPAIIIGDEPTGNLDTSNTHVVLDLFRELTTEKGYTILTVTHDDDFARQSDSVIHLIDGEISK